MTPELMGLLSGAAAGLEASGPSRTPVSLGQVMSRGLLGGMNTYQGAQDQEMRRGLLGLQTLQMQTSMAQAAQKQKALADYAQNLPETERPLFMANPEGYIQSKMKANEPFSLRPGERRYMGGQEIASSPESYTMSPGQIRFTGGNQVASMPEKPETAQDANGVLRYKSGENVGQIVPGFEAQKTPDGFTRAPDGTLKIDPGFLAGKTAIARAGSPVISQSVNTATKAFENEIGKLDAEKLGELRKNAESANGTLRTVASLRNSIGQGVFSGGGAQAKTAISNLISGLTGAQIKNLPGSQLFNAEASTLILDRIKALGANPSNADREFLAQTIPNLSMDPKARDALMNYMENIAKRNIDLYNSADSFARKNSGLGGFNMFQGGNDIPDGWGIQKVN